MLKNLLEGLGDLVFPYHCILCSRFIPDKSLPQLCSACFSAIEFNAPPFCLKCSRHMSFYTPQGLCATCRKYPIAFDEAWGMVSYNEEVQQLLHLFKYHQRTLVRTIFHRFIREFMDRYPLTLSSYDYLAPVPLHPVRERERGFNQSQLMAALLAQTLGTHGPTDILVRVKSTAPQSFLDQKERWTNMQGAFKMKTNFPVNDKSVLLVDDLLTTGATASAAAQTLKDAGAKRVGLFVIALAP